MVKNAYIHIPFCKSKCHYCSFVSFEKLESKDNYVEALKKQIQAQYNGEKLNTLYFGGGTPSVLSTNEFKSLISLFNTDKDTEITTEANPDGLTEDYLKRLRTCGINRISIGSQSFDDEILKLIGRRHDAKQITTAVDLAQKVGFDSISLDLIYGLPAQTIKGFEADLKKVVSLGIQHVSLYGLKIEEGCYFSKHTPKFLPDLDIQADMYLKAIETLTNNGFKHYETSNFAKPSFESKHNLNYWNNNTYYGFGVSASGYQNKCRYTNETNLDNYIKNPTAKIFEQELTEQEILEEEIFLGLRKNEGINVENINNKFSIDFEVKYKKILDKYKETGHLIKTQNGWALSTEGILLSNDILSEFID